MPEPEAPVVELVFDEDSELLATLRAAQAAMLAHPAAAQALFSVLVAEGRRFGATPEGEAWRARLEGSALIRRGRVVWEVGTLNVLEESPEGVLPTQIVDAIARAAAHQALEPLLARLFGLDPAEASRSP